LGPTTASASPDDKLKLTLRKISRELRTQPKFDAEMRTRGPSLGLPHAGAVRENSKYAGKNSTGGQKKTL